MKFQSINFTCKGCGAPLRYSPATQSLRCEFCSSTELISHSNQSIKEYSLKKALQFLETHHPQEIIKEVRCNKCSALFKLTPYSVSSNCPYCNTPTITDFIKEITPQSMLPFSLTQKQAQTKFKKWLGSLWFAPNKLKKLIDGNENLTGYYLPHWTYDAETHSQYHGQRGTIYYVTVERTRVINGQHRRVTKKEARIKWRAIQGVVNNNFDDITIGASKTISHTILDNLAPWDTNRLIPFNTKYLSGFKSEEYTIGLDNGFEYAKMKMDNIIRRDIRADIGGDQQKIEQVKTTYNNTTYKSVLFPIWTAQFDWRGKQYNYAINGQTGKITGERPYSLIKIIMLIGFIIMLFGGVVYIEEHPQYFEDAFNSIRYN
ncbi:MAG TPA: primosomal protein N' (replication factor Y) - superfamily II helicase [Campylobacterales bacterium]|nr:primosomal protein N' (replication factor Y) - superfamily II helicase [Campylobacterales bacterium]